MAAIPIDEGDTLFLCVQPKELFYSRSAGRNIFVAHFEECSDHNCRLSLLPFVFVSYNSSEVFGDVGVLRSVNGTLALGFNVENLWINGELRDDLSGKTRSKVGCEMRYGPQR